MTTDNIYSAPTANLTERPAFQEGVAVGDRFYVVAPLKFFLLFFFTVGFYKIYWFYRNWSNYKDYSWENMRPAARGLFSIFFVHSLFRRVNETIAEKSLSHSWYPTASATIFVILQLVLSIIGRIPDEAGFGNSLVAVQFLLILPVMGKILYSAQGAINVACEDPNGESNSRLTWANWAWMAVGAIFIVLMVIGLIYARE